MLRTLAIAVFVAVGAALISTPPPGGSASAQSPRPATGDAAGSAASPAADPAPSGHVTGAPAARRIEPVVPPVKRARPVAPAATPAVAAGPAPAITKKAEGTAKPARSAPVAAAKSTAGKRVEHRRGRAVVTVVSPPAEPVAAPVATAPPAAGPRVLATGGKSRVGGPVPGRNPRCDKAKIYDARRRACVADPAARSRSAGPRAAAAKPVTPP